MLNRWNLKPVSWWYRVADQRKDSELMLLARKIIFESGANSVLDVGCGVGAFRDLFPGFNYYGVDIAPQAIIEAAKVHPDCGFYCGDFRELALPEVDACFVSSVLEHLDGFTGLQDLFTISKLVVVIFFNKLIESPSQYLPMSQGYYNNVYSRPEIERFTESQGWKVVFHEGVRGPYWNGYAEVPYVSNLGVFTNESG